MAALWAAAASTGRAQPPFLAQEGRVWREIPWAEASLRVDEIAAGLLAMDVGAGDRVAILSRTRLEWALCDQALAAIGAISVPVYPTASAVDSAYVLAHSGATLAIVEDAAQLGKVRQAHEERGVSVRAVVIDGPDGAEPTLGDLAGAGRRLLAAQPRAVDEARARVDEDDPFSYVYTSGTTGTPKGCVITHRNYWEMLDMVRRIPGLVVDGDVALLHLPLAHVFARLVALMVAPVALTVAFCPDATRLATALRSVRPTLFPSVPRVFETMHAGVLSGFERAGGLSRRVASGAVAIGRRAARRREQGRALGPALAAAVRVADHLVYRKVKSRLGGRLRHAISGAAPLRREVAEFFVALDIPVLEGYGLTECTTVATANRPDGFRIGTVGTAVPGGEVAISDDGEILVRGPHVFAGYVADDAATREAITDDGWLRTGDVGQLDADGFLTITERKKDIIVTPGGTNVAPQRIENALCASRYISQAIVVGEGRPYLVALLAVNRDEVGRVARDGAAVDALVEGVVADVNRGLAPEERIRRFAILAREPSEQEGEVTPTLKLRRRVCEQHFREDIERLYAPAGAADVDRS
jgi:long-chain acyl-CoA synthetase